jgi:hypothetical protein
MFPLLMSLGLFWDNHICGYLMLYMSLEPRSVIITLGGQLYRILEVVPTTPPPKQCCKLISHTEKFILFIVCSKDSQNTTITTTT